MLKYRIITAIILIPIFLTLLFILPPNYFALLTGALVMVGAYEWAAFADLKKYALLYMAIIAMLLWISFIIPLAVVLWAALIGWLFGLYLVLTYPRTKNRWSVSIVLRALMGVVVLVPCWQALNFIRSAEHGIYLLLFLFALIWGADIAAYFVGKKFGKHKLAPIVSPGKSIEGLVGALIVTALITVLTCVFLKLPVERSLAVLFLAMLTVLFSVLGDLFESMLKRNIGAKDSGTILPGHGGILDRVDSLTAAAPIFALGLLVLGNFFH